MNRKERRVAEARGKSGGNNTANAQLYAQVGQLMQAGQPHNAMLVCQKVLHLDPLNATALALLGTLKLQFGAFTESVALLTRALALDKRNAMAYTHRGVAQHNLGAYDAAIADYEKAIALAPKVADPYHNLGFTQFTLKRYREAIANFDKAIAINPRSVTAYINRGEGCYALGENEAALASYDQAIAIDPQSVPAYSNRANVLSRLNRPQEALASCDKAIALMPDNAQLYNIRLPLLKTLGREAEAMECAERAIALGPQNAEAWVNHGTMLHQLARYDEALADFDKALAIDPQLAEAKWNKGLTLLLLGDYAQGWALYEARWGTEFEAGRGDIPLWLGKESLAGKTLLVHAEQGLGDTIQFCRYIPLLEELGAKVIFKAPPSFTALGKSIKGNHITVQSGDALPALDYRCPLMSLPLAFATRLETIPAAMPYLFADKDCQQRWQETLGVKTRPRVGLVWSGGSLHKNDRNRSISLAQFQPLLANDMEFHSLQKEVRLGDIMAISQGNVISHASDLNDFSDTAALIMEMDLVVTVDTAVAHLAGALGKPVWILLPFTPDFRWLLNRDDSPWYPAAKLFRQQKPGDWLGVMGRVNEELKRRFSSRSAIRP